MKLLLHIAFVLFISMQLHAQQQTIRGMVTDASDGRALPGVNVIIKGTKTGTQTNFDGEYSLVANVGDVLQFSFVGYKVQEIKIEEETVIDVLLKEDSASLDEVVVVGYGLRGKASGITVGAARSSSRKESKTIVSSGPQSGQLTAGEINDLEKLNEWLKALKSRDYKQIQKDWKFRLTNKIEIHVSNSKNHPLNNIPVSLYDENNTLIMIGRTDIYGKVTLFKDTESNCKSAYYFVQVLQNEKIVGKKITNSYEKVAFVLNDQISSSNSIDIMFTIDATGSMGDEIDYLKSELKDIIGRLDKRITEKRVALTFYRDHGDEYLVRDYDFRTNINDVKAFLKQQEAQGGGDYEEAVEEALKVSMSQSWQPDAKAKLLFLLLDAPPHYTKDNVNIIKDQIKIAQEKGIKIIPIVASGADKNVEFLMRYFSISTNGTYVFLTDDSGIGNPHIKPTTDEFKVEKLNDLIVRLIEKYAGVTS